MAVLRFLSSLFLLVAVIALISDATQPLIGAGPIHATSFTEHWSEISPATLKGAKAAVAASSGVWLWDYFIGLVLGLPTFLLFGGLALWAGQLGRRRSRIRVFAN